MPPSTAESLLKNTLNRKPGPNGPTGIILSTTTLYDVPSSHSAQIPLHFALVRLRDGRQLLAQLTDVADPSQIAIDEEVEMVTRILTTDGASGVIVYGYKFRPLLGKN